MSNLRPMTAVEFAAWRDRKIPAYAAEKVASGQWTENDSLALSEKQINELLPHDLATAENYLFTVVDDNGEAVGVLWFGVQTQFNARIAYVYDVEIHPEHRRQGHAFRAFQELEREVQRLGLGGIALHVFGHNKDAQALYGKLGFEPTNINLFKRVRAADPCNTEPPA